MSPKKNIDVFNRLCFANLSSPDGPRTRALRYITVGGNTGYGAGCRRPTSASQDVENDAVVVYGE